jgi:hypothetical protein
MFFNNFKKNNYKVFKKAISSELAKFIFEYMLLKKDAVKYMYENNILIEHPYYPTCFFGTFKDPLYPKAYCHYGDFATETLLMKVLPIVKKETKMELVPTYSYFRMYEKGSILNRHKDRESCEISCTMNIGGDPWAIYLDPTGENCWSGLDVENGIRTYTYKEKKNPGVKVELNPGDMLIYRGCDLEHWREEFTGNICAQVFLHFNETNKFDGRHSLGVVSKIKGY